MQLSPDLTTIAAAEVGKTLGNSYPISLLPPDVVEVRQFDVSGGGGGGEVFGKMSSKKPVLAYVGTTLLSNYGGSSTALPVPDNPDKSVALLNGHNDGIASIVQLGNLVVTTSFDGTAVLWDLNTSGVGHKIISGSSTGGQLSPDGRYYAYSGETGYQVVATQPSKDSVSAAFSEAVGPYRGIVAWSNRVTKFSPKVDSPIIGFWISARARQ